MDGCTSVIGHGEEMLYCVIFRASVIYPTDAQIDCCKMLKFTLKFT
jgi:hypothetical protein